MQHFEEQDYRQSFDGGAEQMRYGQVQRYADYDMPAEDTPAFAASQQVAAELKERLRLGASEEYYPAYAGFFSGAEGMKRAIDGTGIAPDMAVAAMKETMAGLASEGLGLRTELSQTSEDESSDRSNYPAFVEPITGETHRIPEQEKRDVANKLDEIIDDLMLRFADKIDILPGSNELHLTLPVNEAERWSIMATVHRIEDPDISPSRLDTALDRSVRDISVRRILDGNRQDQYVFYYLDSDHQAFRHNGDVGYLFLPDTENPGLPPDPNAPIIDDIAQIAGRFNVYSEGAENEHLAEAMGLQNQPFTMTECRGLEEWLHQPGIVPDES
jgi:hypothetical protein